MKKKILLPILLLATMSLGGGLVACGKQGNKSADSAQSQYKVAIDNKAALEGEWYEGDAKDLELTLTPEANALQELNNKNLTVTSSDETVVKVTGLGLSALKEGTAKITVDYRGAKEEVNVTILSKSAIKKYGTAHEGTLEDPFTNEDAILVTKSDKYAGEDYYVKGEIVAWYHTPGERSDGNVSYFLKPATAGGERFEVYKCLKQDGKGLSASEIWKGGIATAHGTFTKYGEQCETNSAVFVKCEGTAPGERQVVNATVAEVLTAGKALEDGDSEYNYYNVTGYVVKKSGTSFFMADAKEVAADVKNMFQLYDAKAEGLADKLLENAKITVKAVIKNYHGQVETCLPLANDDVTVLEAGTKWAVPEPTVTAKTVTEFIALENNKNNAYTVKANIKAFKDGETKDEFGNMTITDGTTDLAIYGSSATVTALAWDNAEAYAFTNPKDFLTNEITKDLKVGDEITMKLIRSDYIKDGVTQAIQGQGVITAVTAPDAPTYSLVEKFDFASDLTKYEAYDAAKMNAFIKGSSSLGENTNYVDHVNGKTDENKDSVTDPLIGGNGTWDKVAWSNYNMLKLGSTSKKALMTLNFKADTAIKKIVIKAAGWNGKSNKIGFNGGEQVAIAAAKTAASMEDETAFATYEFELAEAANVINIETTLCVMITEMELYKVEEAAPAPVKAWNADDVKAGHSNANIAAVKDETGDVQFTVYKLGNTNETVTFKYTPTEAGKVKFNLEFTTKYSNAESAYFWKKDATSTEDKMQVSVNGAAITAPAENPNFKAIAGDALVKSEAADNGELANPVFYQLCEIDAVANEELTIVVKYLGGGNSFYIAGATLTK